MRGTRQAALLGLVVIAIGVSVRRSEAGPPTINRDPGIQRVDVAFQLPDASDDVTISFPDASSQLPTSGGAAGFVIPDLNQESSIQIPASSSVTNDIPGFEIPPPGIGMVPVSLDGSELGAMVFPTAGESDGVRESQGGVQLSGSEDESLTVPSGIGISASRGVRVSYVTAHQKNVKWTLNSKGVRVSTVTHTHRLMLKVVVAPHSRLRVRLPAGAFIRGKSATLRRGTPLRCKVKRVVLSPAHRPNTPMWNNWRAVLMRMKATGSR